jgi:hypothetical protein
MIMRTHCHGWSMMAALVALVAGFGVKDAIASCNVIPALSTDYRAALGEADRPFAGPGEILRIGVRPALCDQESPGLVSRNPADYVVTVVFTPPGDRADRNTVVVLAPDCGALSDGVRRCGERPDVGTATCLDTAAGGARRVEILDLETKRVVSLRFPDTDALVDGAADGRTLTGPATIAVTQVGAPLPCALASTRCADGTGLPGLVACVDELFARDGTCDTSSADLGPTFAHFTALPPVNDFRTILMDPCSSTGPSNGAASEVRFTVDAAGNALVPVDWRGTATTRAGASLPRALYGSTTVGAFLALAGRIELPGATFLSSYMPSGTPLPPIFGVQTSSKDVSLFGSLDVPFTVLRVARRNPLFHACSDGAHGGRPCGNDGDCPGGTCGQGRCAGGTSAGAGCTSDRECPASECGPALFDFRDRLVAGVGPVIIPRIAAAVADGVVESSIAMCDGSDRRP